MYSYATSRHMRFHIRSEPVHSYLHNQESLLHQALTSLRSTCRTVPVGRCSGNGTIFLTIWGHTRGSARSYALFEAALIRLSNTQTNSNTLTLTRDKPHSHAKSVAPSIRKLRFSTTSPTITSRQRLLNLKLCLINQIKTLRAHPLSLRSC